MLFEIVSQTHNSINPWCFFLIQKAKHIGGNVADLHNFIYQTLTQHNHLFKIPLVLLTFHLFLIFIGDWDEQFEAHNTRSHPFKVSPEETKSVPMMCAKRKYAYIERQDLKCKAIEIPYKGRELSMVVILPTEDFGLQVAISMFEVKCL